MNSAAMRASFALLATDRLLMLRRPAVLARLVRIWLKHPLGHRQIPRSLERMRPKCSFPRAAKQERRKQMPQPSLPQFPGLEPQSVTQLQAFLSRQPEPRDRLAEFQSNNAIFLVCGNGHT